MSETVSTAGALAATHWTVTAPKPIGHDGAKEERVGAGGLIECIVMTADEIILRPKCELAKSVLDGMVSGEKHFIAEGHFPPAERRGYGRNLTQLRITVTHHPLLSRGGDPLFTGVSLSHEEAAYLREQLDQMRRAKQPKPRTRKAIRKRAK